MKTQPIPRLRMFAGPYGSGKSTITSVISPELLGIYINPDEIEADIGGRGFFDFKRYFVQTTSQEVYAFLSNSSLLKKAELIDELTFLGFKDDKLNFHDIEVNAYFASVIADFVRGKLLEMGKSFTMETVMSSPDKIDLLHHARKQGYRTYLYYIATEDPEINISRVRFRMETGGHSVPEDKIISRYYRSLDLLMEAVQLTDRAYVFDNSGHEHIWVAEITGGKTLEMKSDSMPGWFKRSLWDKFRQEGAISSNPLAGI